MPPYHKLKPCLLFLFVFVQLVPYTLLAQQKQALHDPKLAPPLHHLGQDVPSATYRVQVTDKATFYTWLKQAQPQATVAELPGQEQILLVSGLSGAQLRQLLGTSLVRYIDRPNRKAVEELELKDTDFVANNIYAAQYRFPDLTGQGMAVSVKENPFDPSDIDLRGRVLAPQPASEVPSIHATTMATIISGAGNSGPGGKGVTWRSSIAFSDFAELYPDNSAELLAQGISVQNHSYGVGIENYYGLEAEAYDKETFQNPTLLHVFSSGNSGDQTDATGQYANLPGIANLTGQFKTSKNTLSVGALDAEGTVGIRSSRGPAYDGRIKPEVVAHGAAGTSESAAVVSGIALLVQQAYKARHDALPPAALVKAALVNSAEDVGRPGPDFESGFGNVDALGAVRAVEEGRFFMGSVAGGETKVYEIAIPAGTRLMKATLVWHEQSADPNADRALRNDLDLTLRRNSNGTTWRPWVLSSYPHADSLRLPAKRGIDRLNNIEQITLNTPRSGGYTLRVQGHQVQDGPQDFSLVFEYIRGSEWLYPMAGVSLLAGQANQVSWEGGALAGTGRLEYQVAGSGQWHTISDGIDLRSNTYTWQAPEIAAPAQLRLVSGTSTLLSQEFVLAPALQPQVGFNCQEQALLHWPAIPNVQQYQLYSLGDTHLEPLLTATDTLVLLDKASLPSEFVTVVPVVQGIDAPNSRSLSFSSAASGCYVSSFLARQFVMDTVWLDLELSTLYQVASFTLERLDRNEFRAIQSQNTVTARQHLLTDAQPRNGRNVYRVSIRTTDGKTYYSDPEEVIYARENFMQVYPNPVVGGQAFQIAVSSGSALIQLYDRLGKLVLETNSTGILKEVQTKGLSKGLYIIRLRSESGLYLTDKVLVL